MIDKVLAYYVSRLDEYLRRSFPRPEGMAEVGAVGGSDREKPCKIVVSVLSVERETAGGIAAPVQRVGGEYTRAFPPMQLNVNLMLAAVYDEKRYAESLTVLSASLNFLQATPCFECGGHSYTMEVMNLSMQDINNVWTTLGGLYYPSVVCKLRGLTIDAGVLAGSGTNVTRTDT